ncbi:MAG: CAP domain-containing protein [Bacteroidota bacterium]
MRQSPFFLLLLIMLVSCTACETDLATGDVLVEETTDAQADNTDATFSALAITALDLVNETRQVGCLCGTQRMPPVGTLQLHPQLVTAAQVHADDQAAMQKMDHRGSDGSTVGSRLTHAGFSWRAVAVNVAWNYPNIEAVTQGWFDSPGHCRNLMNPDYTFFGIGERDLYWTQVFAR